MFDFILNAIFKGMPHFRRNGRHIDGYHSHRRHYTSPKWSWSSWWSWRHQYYWGFSTNWRLRSGTENFRLQLTVGSAPHFKRYRTTDRFGSGLRISWTQSRFTSYSPKENYWLLIDRQPIDGLPTDWFPFNRFFINRLPNDRLSIDRLLIDRVSNYFKVHYSSDTPHVVTIDWMAFPSKKCFNKMIVQTKC